ncbi:MAG: zinc ribbon domain-containing protein [Bacteroides sp.]|nr:zinc ribbon domain-containing protein [Bacteroides sp.]
MRCPSCNKENQENRKFCTFCGAKLPQAKYCPKCGRVLNPDKKFCEGCGAPNDSYSNPGALYPVFSQPTQAASSDQMPAQPIEVPDQDVAVNAVQELLPKDKDIKYCPKCGGELDPDKNFCEKYGDPNYSDSQVDNTCQVFTQPEVPQNADQLASNSEQESQPDDQSVSDVTSSEDLPVHEDLKKGSSAGRWIAGILIVVVLAGGVLVLGQRLNWWNIEQLSWAGGNDSHDTLADASNTHSVPPSYDGVETDTDSQCFGMLKAFGIKGKVRTITFSDASEENNAITLSFDLKGNLLDYPDYNGGKVSKDVSGPYFYSSISFNDWKWTNISFGGYMNAETSYEMIRYDEYNRPTIANLLIENEVVKKNLQISYSGSDTEGNYTEIHLDTKGINYDGAFPVLIETMNVKIDYWPDDASATDVPTKLSENEAIELIKKANIKENVALSADLKKIVDYDTGKSTLINYGEFAYVPDMVIRVSEISIGESGNTASVVFYFAPMYDGQYDKADLTDTEYLRLADFVYENGGWKVDDIGWDVGYTRGVYYYGKSYKEYKRKY